MDDAVKNRLGILRVYAELDKEHRQLLRQIGRAEIALINQNFILILN